MGPIGMQEMFFIVILALLLFGPKKLPELARLLGKGMTEFRRAKNELKSTFDTHMRELERETRMEEARKSAASAPAPSSYSYPTDEFGHNQSYGSWPSEPEVTPHAVETETANANIPAAVAGTVPRSTSDVNADHGTGKEQHSS